MKDTRFSLEKVFQLRGQASAKIREHADSIHDIAEACEQLDYVIQNCTSEQSVDNQQDVLTAARRLATLIAGEVA